LRLSQFLPPKQPLTGNNREIGERQTEGQARHKAEWVKPSRYDDEGQNVGDENVSKSLTAYGTTPGFIADRYLLQPTPERVDGCFSGHGELIVVSSRSYTTDGC
jgi:hypothetical protein